MKLRVVFIFPLASNMKVSEPVPPEIFFTARSIPAVAYKMSSPLPPSKVSLPPQPFNMSLSSPPSSLSVPLSPSIMSLPP